MAPILLLLASLWIAVGSASVASSKNASSDDSHRGQPNFIFIMTDDQDLLLNSLDYQPLVKRHFIDKGTMFQKHFCTVSICCPSRVSLLTGRAAHNTNVTDVAAPYGGYSKFIAEGLNDRYLPVWLQEAGYNTYFTGKLMNGHATDSYDKPYAAGWTRSEFLLDPYTYLYNNASTVLDNGEYTFNPGRYSTDLIAERSVEFLDDAVAGGRPFFLIVNPMAPHAETIFHAETVFQRGGVQHNPPVPAERHEHLFADAQVPRTPSFNPIVPASVKYLNNLEMLTAD
ncbi:hypothetical protein G6O67_005161 [Ophiocordyceps sinensis]|uniref:Sulfatase N-terminal domain-containing protein n=1 Tax=Ophiocordyceps sinensis TaxID=72228 RepID=A0A8H4PQV6_9HYPO|nr:hypothetical protein G6O67_005161 [Ophiocordyceps sinensis]